jgi:hypothetical protein
MRGSSPPILEVSEISLPSSSNLVATMLPVSPWWVFRVVAVHEKVADPVDAATDSSHTGWIAGNREI